MKGAELLTSLKEALRVENNSALARRIGVTPGCVTHISYFSAYQIKKDLIAVESLLILIMQNDVMNAWIEKALALLPLAKL